MLIQLKRRRAGDIQNVEFLAQNLDLARGHVWINGTLRASSHAAPGAQYELVAHAVCSGETVFGVRVVHDGLLGDTSSLRLRYMGTWHEAHSYDFTLGDLAVADRMSHQAEARLAFRRALGDGGQLRYGLDATYMAGDGLALTLEGTPFEVASAADGWSVSIIMRDLMALYAPGGEPPRLPPVTSYRDYLARIA